MRPTLGARTANERERENQSCLTPFPSRLLIYYIHLYSPARQQRIGPIFAVETDGVYLSPISKLRTAIFSIETLETLLDISIS